MTATGRRWLCALALAASLVPAAPAVAAVEFTGTPSPYSSSGSGPFEWQFASDDPSLAGGLAYNLSSTTGWERCRDAAVVSIGDLADGEYTLTVKGDYSPGYHTANGLELPAECLSSEDPGGSVLATRSFVVDSVRPSISVRRVLIAGLEVGVEVTAVDAATGIGGYEWDMGDGFRTATPAGHLGYRYAAFGTYRARVTARDLAGNRTTVAVDFVLPQPIDTDPPETTIVKPAPPKLAGSRTKYRFVSDEIGVRYQCRLDDRRFRRCRTPKWVKRLREGPHRFQVRAIDRAGNVDPSPAIDRFEVVGAG